MACDGEIADVEVKHIAEFAKEQGLDKTLDIEKTLNQFVSDINCLKQGFLNEYIKDLANANLKEEDELNIAKIAVDMILADEVIEYSEIKFFKRIRSKLKISDEEIRKVLPEDNDDPNVPNKEDFFAPDIYVPEEELWDINFEEIKLNLKVPQDNGTIIE